MLLVLNEREMFLVLRIRINEYFLLKEEKFVIIVKCEINIIGERKMCLFWKEIKCMLLVCIEFGERYWLGVICI